MTFVIDTSSQALNLDFCIGIAAYAWSDTNFTLSAQTVFGSGAGLGSSYTSQADAQAAVAAFVGEVGYPWVEIGAVPDPVSEGAYIVAVNMARVVTMYDNSGSGLTFTVGEYEVGSAYSNGYSPWSDSATAIAALLVLTGQVADVP